MSLPDRELLAQLLEADLRVDEGVRYVPYLDNSPAKVPTVGVGHNCKVSPLPSDWMPPLTDGQVTLLLSKDMQIAFNALDADLPWWSDLDIVRQRVIANMCFQLGIAGLLEFKLALAALKVYDYAQVAAQMKDSAWYTQVPNRAKRLCNWMETGNAVWA